LLFSGSNFARNYSAQQQLRARKLNKEDAADRSKWRKLMKDL